MITDDSVVYYLDPGISSNVGEGSAVAGQTEAPAEPRKSFARGVMVGLAVAVPVWALIIIALVR
jgi:hypothetical protein